MTGSSGKSTLGPWTRQSEWSGIVVNVSSESCVGTQLRSFGVILNQQGYPAATVSCVLGLYLLVYSEWPLTNKVIGSRESREGTLPLSLPRRLIQDRHWRQLQDSQRSEKGAIPLTRERRRRWSRSPGYQRCGVLCRRPQLRGVRVDLAAGSGSVGRCSRDCGDMFSSSPLSSPRYASRLLGSHGTGGELEGLPLIDFLPCVCPRRLHCLHLISALPGSLG